MYSIGEKIMYGGTGVCVVEDITTLKLSGMTEPRSYYVLRPLYQSGTIQTPVDNTKVPIRPVMTRSEAEMLVDAIPGIDPVICYEKNLSALRNHYQQQLNTFNCRDHLRQEKRGGEPSEKDRYDGRKISPPGRGPSFRRAGGGAGHLPGRRAPVHLQPS